MKYDPWPSCPQCPKRQRRGRTHGPCPWHRSLELAECFIDGYVPAPYRNRGMIRILAESIYSEMLNFHQYVQKRSDGEREIRDIFEPLLGRKMGKIISHGASE